MSQVLPAPHPFINSPRSVTAGSALSKHHGRGNGHATGSEGLGARGSGLGLTNLKRSVPGIFLGGRRAPLRLRVRLRRRTCCLLGGRLTRLAGWVGGWTEGRMDGRTTVPARRPPGPAEGSGFPGGPCQHAGDTPPFPGPTGKARPWATPARPASPAQRAPNL